MVYSVVRLLVSLIAISSRKYKLINLSVVICSHNPRMDYLGKVIAALAHQSLPKNEWELILVDNNSNEKLSSIVDLSSMLNSSVCIEERLGLTNARIKGVNSCNSDLIVFVYDDNVLSPEYLQKALCIAKEYPFLGAWGGSTVGVFEEPPLGGLQKYVDLLGVREITENRWGNIQDINNSPIGAGMVIRSSVALEYCKKVINDRRRLSLDRIGNLLGGSGDLDMAYTACDMGMGIGVFACLELDHLIPSRRVEPEYMVKLMEESVFSSTLLSHIRGRQVVLSGGGGKIIRALRYIRDRRSLPTEDIQMRKAYQRGVVRAHVEIAREN